MPIISALGNWGLDWRTGTPELRARQELMRTGGEQFIQAFMDELRSAHLRNSPATEGPSVLDQLDAAYQAASAQGK